ncbi:MAG: ABC transporter permease [Thermoproteota archaeon]|nr:ABC transporter permease [Candidatus Brockarchaeota archaeon]MBO3802169.1 ABC transporter permease [Candidatus Brockarchaeota archaeon]
MSDENMSSKNKGKIKISTFYLRIVRSILKDPLALLGLLIVVCFFSISILVALLGDYILPYDPIKMDFSSILVPPSLNHLFGTDRYGRDIFSRILAAAPTDAFVSVEVIILSAIIGIVLGTLSGFAGRAIDEIVMRLTDIFFSFPSIILAIAIAAVLGPGVRNAAIAITATWWPTYVRLARAETLRIKSLEFVEAAKVSNLSSYQIVLKHIIPNILPTIITYATLDLGGVILTYAGLSYFGLGAQPPLPEWGSEVFAGQDYLVVAPWWPIFPGLVIAIVSIGFALLGDGVRDAFSKQFVSK